jgi:hypothetical protein
VPAPAASPKRNLTCSPWRKAVALFRRAHPSPAEFPGPLAGAFGPLRRALAPIAQRLIDSRAPARVCYSRLSDYARERPGISARQLQELARVHLALLALPALERALIDNELPWSKVRLIARVACAEDERSWVSRARGVSVRQLEEAVRQRDENPQPIDLADASPDARVALRCTPAVSEKWHLTKEFAERVAGRCLPAGEALELAAAEVFSAISIDREVAMDAETDSILDPLSPPEPDPLEPTRPAEFDPTPARELPAAISSLVTGLAEADAFELDRRLRSAIRLEQSLDAAIAPLLRIVTSSEYEWSGDYRTLANYATEQLGMSPAKARALLRLERAGDLCPELRAAYRSGQISWVKAQCLLPLVRLDIPGAWRPTWLAWAQRVTLRRLEQDVERALLLQSARPPRELPLPRRVGRAGQSDHALCVSPPALSACGSASGAWHSPGWARVRDRAAGRSLAAASVLLGGCHHGVIAGGGSGGGPAGARTLDRRIKRSGGP